MSGLSLVQVADTNYSSLRQQNFQEASLLVVEDQEDVWMIIQFCLAKYFSGIHIHRCTNRSETIAYFTRQIADGVKLPQLILQDLYLPQREDGFGLLQDIRTLLSPHQQIPLLIMSSSEQEDDVRQAYQLGASFYLVKPFTVNSWLHLIQNLHQFWWKDGVLPLAVPINRKDHSQRR